MVRELPSAQVALKRRRMLTKSWPVTGEIMVPAPITSFSCAPIGPYVVLYTPRDKGHVNKGIVR